MKNVLNQKTNTLYGYFPEVPGALGRVDIDAEWVKENVEQYKKLGMELAVCQRELTVIVGNDQFAWISPEMKEQFHEDIVAFFGK